MKKTFGLMIAMMLLIIPASMAAAGSILVSTNSALEVTLLNYQPVPAQPGDVIDVWIQVTNDGGTMSGPGIATVVDSYPFKVESDTERWKEFNAVPAQESFLFKTRVRVDKNANEGTNYLTIQVQENDAEDYIEGDLPITVQGRSSALSIVKTESTPSIIAPGSEGELKVTVKNVGDTKLRNVEMTLDLSELAVAPTTSSDSKTVGSIEGGKTSEFVFNLLAFPAAEANAYQIPVTLTYEDEQGNSVTQEKTIGIVVGSEPELLVYLERNDMSSETMEGNIVVKFVNKGLSEIKLLEMEIPETEGIEITSESNIIYVGNIDQDDYESADVSLKVSEQHVDVPIKVTYRDSLNKLHEETYKIAVDIKNGTGKSSSNTWIILLVIVVVVAGFFWWRSTKGKKKH